MKQRRKFFYLPLLLALLVFGAGPSASRAQEPDTSDLVIPPPPPPLEPLLPNVPESDVPYVPTPRPVVDKMLEMADVDSTDVVYDLGSGDGRIVIRAARKYGARGVGIEIDSQRVEDARKNAREASVADRVEFRQGDLFEADISEATAVTLYLLPSVNLKLRPKLFEELAPGTPVVSHDFDMGAWRPEKTVEVDGDTVYRWTIPDEVPEHLREKQLHEQQK